VRTIIVIAVCFAALSGCQRSPSPKKPPQKITIAYTTQPDSALVHIALQKGFFAEEGLEVQPQLHSFGKAALKSVLEGKADLATAAETPLMFAALDGEKFFIVAGIFTTSRNNAIIGRRDLGISQAADLRGKRIGYTPGTTGEFFLDSFLTANGITVKDVQLVPIKPEEITAALTGGKVDAVSCWNFSLTTLRRVLGQQGVTFFDAQIYTQTFNLVGRQEYVSKNPETLRGALRALVKAENFAREHAEAAQTLVAASLKVDRGLLQEIWSGLRYKVELDRRLLITLEDQTRWAMKNRPAGMLAMPDYGGLIHPDALTAVKPDAVTLNR
jgi:ABC-type nitrate/sulfonate/bicarbonate transport system substrate-binding protein